MTGMQHMRLFAWTSDVSGYLWILQEIEDQEESPAIVLHSLLSRPEQLQYFREMRALMSWKAKSFEAVIS